MEFRKQKHRLRPTWHLCAYAQEKGIFERRVVHRVHTPVCSSFYLKYFHRQVEFYKCGHPQVILGLVFYLQSELAANGYKGQAHSDMRSRTLRDQYLIGKATRSRDK